MSTDQHIKFYQRLRTICLPQLAAIDEALSELDKENETPAPRKRRNLKAERTQQCRIETMTNKWSRPSKSKKPV